MTNSSCTPNRARHRFAFAVVVLSLLAAAGCWSTSPLEPPSGEPLVRGVIVSLEITAALGSIRVDGDSEGGFPCGIVARIDGRTQVLLPREGGGWRQGFPGDLALGDRVEVHPRGPVADSCPYQGTAGVITRLPRGG